MTNVNSTITPWFATTQLNAPELRHALSAAFGSSPTPGIAAESGVLPGGGTTQSAFVPTSNGSASNPSVSVAPGQLVLVRPTGGTYVCTWPVAQTIALDLALPAAGQTRYDLLVGEVVDPEADSGATTGTVFRLTTIKGTASASPALPTVANSGQVPLWSWKVSNAGAITEIVSRRPFTRAAGGLRCVETGDTRAGSYPGDLRIFPSGQIDAWVGGAWMTVVAPVAWTQFAPVLDTDAGQITLGTGGGAVGRYLQVGKLCHLRYAFRAGGSGFNGRYGPVRTYLPPGITSAPSEETQILAKMNVVAQPGGGTWGILNGLCFIPPSSTRMTLWFPYSRADCGLGPYTISGDAQGLVGSGLPIVPGGYPIPGVLIVQGTIETS